MLRKCVTSKVNFRLRYSRALFSSKVEGVGLLKQGEQVEQSDRPKARRRQEREKRTPFEE